MHSYKTDIWFVSGRGVQDVAWGKNKELQQVFAVGINKFFTSVMYCLLCGQRSEFQIPHSFFWQQHLCPEIFHILQTNPTGSLCIWEAETSSPNVTVTGGRCCIDAPVNLKVLLGKWLSFLDEQGGKNSSPSGRESSGQVYEELFRRTHLVSQMLFLWKWLL